MTGANPWTYYEGMELRDWFAGQALVALIHEYDDAEPTAKKAYEMADAMMKARKENNDD